MNKQDTVVALSTPPLMAALAVIRMSGPDALAIVSRFFSAPLDGVAGGKAVHGYIVDGEKTLDEVVLTVFRAPASYTGEDTVEISCHGSMYIVNSVLELAVRHGARRAARGEFTKRAFVNGKLDLVKAEAVIDLIEAETGKETEVALSSLKGRLSEQIRTLRESLVFLAARLLVYVDFPDDEVGDLSDEELFETIEKTLAEIRRLQQSYKQGKLIKDGVRTVICGSPNAGKSTLMNRLLGQDRSIVTDIAGTTRDIVEESVVFGGIKLLLADTAGLRVSEDVLEKIGIERAYSKVEEADLLLYVYDVSANPEEIPEPVLKATGKKIAVLNKIDQCAVDPAAWNKENAFDAVCAISAATGEGIDALEKAVQSLCASLSASDVVVMNARQYECLVRSAEALENAVAHKGFTADALLTDVESAIAALGEITGLTVTSEIVDQIFSRFCVGK